MVLCLLVGFDFDVSEFVPLFIGHHGQLGSVIFRFPSGTLITSGAFRLTRNPIYASWMVLLLPGLSLLLNNWLFLAAAAAMHIAFHSFIEKEEQTMRDAFVSDNVGVLGASAGAQLSMIYPY